MDRLTELSKEISYALRHALWKYELEKIYILIIVKTGMLITKRIN